MSNQPVGWFFTFPQRISALRDRYVLIHSHCPEQARQEMIDACGLSWAFQYHATKLPRHKAQFGLTEIPLSEAAAILPSLFAQDRAKARQDLERAYTDLNRLRASKILAAPERYIIAQSLEELERIFKNFDRITKDLEPPNA